MPVNLNTYREEVEAGLPNELKDMDEALERQAFYDYDGFRYESRFRRDAESSFDFQGRSHRGSGFLRQCISILCRHLYSPGPSRRWSEPSGDELIQRIYADNFIDSLMLEADKLSTLSDWVAIQIDAGEGDFEAKPITYRLWARQDVCVWTDPDDANKPLVVCTKDKYDQQTRYRLWSEEEVWTFLTKKVMPLQTAGGRTATLESKEDHDYGMLPFSFVHYELPIRDFDCVAIGSFLHKAQVAIDDRLSMLDESIKKYLNPIPVAEGVPDEWKPNIEPGRFIRMPPGNPRLAPGGGYEPGDSARLYYIQANIDVTGAWEDLNSYIDQALRAAEIPKSAVVMEQMGVASGISLIVEQEPLIRRTKSRRPTFKVYETDLARRTLICVGNHYDKPEYVTAAENGHLAIYWGPQTIAVKTPDLLEMAVAEVQAGLESHLGVMQMWWEIDRDAALDKAKQLVQDQKDLAAVNPDVVELAAPNPNTPPDENPAEFAAGVASKNGKGEP